MDYTPSPYYNPIYDIRREQIKAGELEEGARFPKPLIDTAPKEEEQQEEQFDPCPPGYQLVDGVCQPDSMFQPSSGDGGETTPFESPYYGDIYLPMAGGMAQGDPNVPYGEYRTPTVNTELMRFAAQGAYQPTIGSTIGDLFRKGMQFSPVMGLLNAFGLGPSYTETVTPRFEGSAMPTGATGAPESSISDISLLQQAQNYADTLVSSGASEKAAQSVAKAMTNEKAKEAAGKAFKEAQTTQAKKEGSKQRDRMVTSSVGRSYTGGPTVRGKSGMLGGGV
jgi:hypothetical protein